MITRKSLFKSCLFICFLFLIAGCSPHDQLKDARKYYRSDNYVPAIYLYDKFIQKNRHTAVETLAELERSECYYQLGLQAYKKENWVLANRLFFLANSHNADLLADNVLLKLAEEAEKLGDQETQLKYYNHVIHYIPDSELLPHLLRKRIDLFLNKSKFFSAYNDYKKLRDEFPDSEEAIDAMSVIDPLIPEFLKTPRLSLQKKHFDSAISEFILYARYPSSYQNEILSDIANCYYQWAIDDLKKNDLKKMKQHLDYALEYDKKIEPNVSMLIQNTCDRFIQMGDSLLAEAEAKAAISLYNNCFLLLPDDATAQEKIVDAIQQQITLQKADSLFAAAQLQENRNQYQKAKELYKESFILSNKPAVKAKSDEMDNFIRAENNPMSFALQIIRDFQNGIIKKNVDNKIAELEKVYGEQMSVSDWKAVYSYGEFNYEVRIDLYSPGDSYYFAWRINLIDKSISPLNKDSEAMMK